MKKLITILIFQFILVPFEINANENFFVEIEALKLVMEEYEKDIDIEPGSELELNDNDNKPSYMALKQDECNATVKVTEKTGLEIVGTESFDVNVCKKEVNKIIN
tara:strand:+ start:15 stop:329 length:315 start_codon:yes stop_codon:yes gene_type:complete